MRYVGVLCLLFAACASSPPENPYECAVWDATDSPTWGLVDVKSPLFETLESLVPEGHFGSEHVCWYQLSTGNLEAFPWRGAYDTGFEFERTDTGWKFLKRNDYFVLSHRRRG